MTVTGPNTTAKALQGNLAILPNAFFLFWALINSNLYLGWTHVHLKWGQCHDDRYNGSRHLTILLLQQPVNVINDEVPRGCRRMASAAASRHWLIDWVRETLCRDRAWHGRDDKNIITTATASKLFTTNYAQQLCTALVSYSHIALLPASQGHQEKEVIEKLFMSMWLMQESYFGLWLMMIKSRHTQQHVLITPVNL